MTTEQCVIPIHKPKNTEMIFFFICGVIMSIPITIVSASLANSLLAGLEANVATLLSLTLFTPFIEEFSKIFPLYYRHGETQRSILNLAIMVGLGFGLIELFEYVLLFGAPVFSQWHRLLFHPSTALISAYGIATKRPLPFYMLAVALHFSANFFAGIVPFPFSSVFFIFVGLAVYLAWMFYAKTKEKVIAYD